MMGHIQLVFIREVLPFGTSGMAKNLEYRVFHKAPLFERCVSKFREHYLFTIICDHPPRNQCKVTPGSFSVYVISRKYMS